MKHLKGAHVPHKKNTGLSPVIMGTPKTVTIPTVMHIGAPAKVVVKAGEHVDIGALCCHNQFLDACNVCLHIFPDYILLYYGYFHNIIRLQMRRYIFWSS